MNLKIPGDRAVHRELFYEYKLSCIDSYALDVYANQDRSAQFFSEGLRSER